MYLIMKCNCNAVQCKCDAHILQFSPAPNNDFDPTE